MRIFAVSDIHADYEVNAKWVGDLSRWDHRDDILLLAGDITDSLTLLDWCLGNFAARFRKVLYVPGNHELWVRNAEDATKTSLDKFNEVVKVCEAAGCSLKPHRERGLALIPLLGWYDYSFGWPSDELKGMWMDYRACRWPTGFDAQHVANHFLRMNESHVTAAEEMVISFSHFLPRIDLMPRHYPTGLRSLYPVLGSARIESQLRKLNSKIHVYGHSHLNRSATLDGVLYLNNAFGYPHESRIASKRLRLVHEN